MPADTPPDQTPAGAPPGDPASTDPASTDPVSGDPIAGDPASGDIVDAVVEEVRAELAERRRAGELPHLPAGELARHFDGVVEAVDGALVEVPPIDAGGLRDSATLATWRPGSIRSRLLGFVLAPLSRLLGVLIRRQVGPFAERSAEIVDELVDRQNRMQRFLTRAHLDRIRSLEYRVAELERELGELRGPGGDTR